MSSIDEQFKLIVQKIESEKQKSKERISKLIDKEKNSEILINLVKEEKEKTAKKVEQLSNQKEAIYKREQVRKRKLRTRRLIEHGALVEKYFNCADMQTPDFEKLLQEILRLKEFGENAEYLASQKAAGQQKK